MIIVWPASRENIQKLPNGITVEYCKSAENSRGPCIVGISRSHLGKALLSPKGSDYNGTSTNWKFNIHISDELIVAFKLLKIIAVFNRNDPIRDLVAEATELYKFPEEFVNYFAAIAAKPMIEDREAVISQAKQFLNDYADLVRDIDNGERNSSPVGEA